MKSAGKFQGLSRGMVIGCDMVAGVVVGGAIGWWLDRVTGWYPWCFLVFFVLGAAAGFRMVYAKMMKSDDKGQR
jgi:ATP synthase protein I